MTLRETVNQLFDLSVGGYFNREKRTRRDLYYQLNALFNSTTSNQDKVIFEIALPDGWWFFSVSRRGNEYDYYIPDTRDQETRLKDWLVNRG